MNLSVLTSTRHDWETPQAFFDRLDAEFGFELDAAADHDNALCPDYFTAEDDGLSQSFGGRTTFLNPPYGYGIGRWVEKAYREAQAGATVVLLIPARTETSWWHRYVMRAAEIRLIRGRLRFSNSAVNAPFPSAVVVFRPGDHTPVFSAFDRE